MKIPKKKFFPQFHSALFGSLENLRGKKISVIGHVRPDGDALGSQIAITRMLRALDYDAIAICYSPIPLDLQFMIGDTPIISQDHTADLRDVCILVDCAARERAGADFEVRLPHVELNIDHHISNPNFASHNLVDTKAAATCEIIAGLFIDLDLPLDPVSAQALYVGIATDTGQFSYLSTTARIFNLAERLVLLGASPSEAANQLYFQNSFAKRKLLERFLSHMEVYFEGKLIVSTLHDRDYKELNACYEDAEGLIDYIRSIKDVQIAAFIDDRSTFSKVSLRSNNPLYDVSQIVAKLGGGGHKMAAGATMQGDWENLLHVLLEEIHAVFER